MRLSPTLKRFSLKGTIFYYMDMVVLSNRSQQTVPGAIAHIKGLSYLSDYDVIMRMECLNRRGHKMGNELKLVKCSFLL